MKKTERGTRDAGRDDGARGGRRDAGGAAADARPTLHDAYTPEANSLDPVRPSVAEAPRANEPAPEPFVVRSAPRSLRQRAELRGGTLELLLFRVGAEMFGIELESVEEALDVPALHRIPEMPENLLGLIPLRGALVPLYAPDTALGAGLQEPASALVFHGGGRRLAIAVDDVDDVLTLPLPALRDVPGTDAGDGVLAGVARRERDLIGVLDVEALLAQLRAGHAVETP